MQSGSSPGSVVWRRQGGVGGSAGLLLTCGLLWGCASPGPPRPPSLFIPRVVTDVVAVRHGDEVTLRFTIPTLSTDGQPLRPQELQGILCRQDVKGAPCQRVDTAETVHALSIPRGGSAAPVTWMDALPAVLCRGEGRPIAYRVQLSNAAGKTAGFSDPVYAAAGAAPATPVAFRADGSRLGVVLRWEAADGAEEVRLQRRPATAATARNPVHTPIAASPAKPPHRGRSGPHAGTTPARRPEQGGPAWLDTTAEADRLGATVDNNIEPEVPYVYTAVRRKEIRLGGRTLEMESEPSAAVSITWHDVYPPAPPTRLMALGYRIPEQPGKAAGYAVDLVWEPVEDRQLAGYLVFRQRLDGAKEELPGEGQELLTPQPVLTPGFHDATALPSNRYRYSVLAVGSNGQRSSLVTAVVDANGQI